MILFRDAVGGRELIRIRCEIPVPPPPPPGGPPQRIIWLVFPFPRPNRNFPPLCELLFANDPKGVLPAPAGPGIPPPVIELEANRPNVFGNDTVIARVYFQDDPIPSAEQAQKEGVKLYYLVCGKNLLGEDIQVLSEATPDPNR